MRQIIPFGRDTGGHVGYQVAVQSAEDGDPVDGVDGILGPHPQAMYYGGRITPGLVTSGRP